VILALLVSACGDEDTREARDPSAAVLAEWRGMQRCYFMSYPAHLAEYDRLMADLHYAKLVAGTPIPERLKSYPEEAPSFRETCR
jgi:hypothetical protein